MKRFLQLLLLLALTLIAPPSSVSAEDCQTDCRRQCRACALGICIVEPSCHIKCETAKKTACAIGSSLPTVPLTPYEQTKTALEKSCGAAFDTIMKGTVGFCGNHDGRLDGQDRIEEAKSILIRAGLVDAREFDGLQIRFCPINGEGLAAERGRIYLNPSMISSDNVNLASLLGHEMIHIRQYRNGGSDNFKCNYSRKFVECGGCQDRRHSMEDEAYSWQDANFSRIHAATYSFTPFPTPSGQQPPTPSQSIVATACFTPIGACPMAMALPRSSPCFCPTMQGPVWGEAR